jgi:GT2 family glycosyltransferase
MPTETSLLIEPSTIITIAIPCLNEETHIAACLESVRKFQIPRNIELEILILDGVSTDHTRAIVQAYVKNDARVLLISNPRKIQSTALNKAIEMSKGEWFLRLDAHTYYPSDYVCQCLQTAQRVGAANVGGRWETQAGGTAYGAEAVQALTTHRFGVGNSPFRTSRPEGKADTVPFGFFRRSVFEEAGLFDERLERMEDFEFNSRLRKLGHVVWLNPAIRCFYYNQPTLCAFLKKQFFREAPYNVYLWYLAPYAFAIRHAVTGIFVGWIAIGLLVSAFWPSAAIVPAATLVAYLCLAMMAAAQQAVRYKRPRHLFALPLGFLAFHLIHGVGMWNAALKLLLGCAPVQQGKEPWPGAGYFRWKRSHKNKTSSHS